MQKYDHLALATRFLDVIEQDIMPLTEKAVRIGCKVFGAAVLRRDDLSLVVAGTNQDAFSPLWHGEVYTIKLFYELQGHPDPSDCLFLSTHEPCSMCISALAWSGFKDIFYFFGYEHTKEDFNIPHDLKMLKEVFGCDHPTPKNQYYTKHSIMEMIKSIQEPERSQLEARVSSIREGYAGMSQVYQAGEKKMILK
ncbi:cytosine/adenosine deaminase [Thermanaerovibrio velox DSM 12556]|uniref:Cytosine/adenosine deaminase n=1 Tax=Thermanaerovibrio velox DSM 12556 TaxID=926567 RepID=H0UQK1_9BACT|nr:nucleoside deaminase [Thermanaerovibrio velox]EHM10765.1 cytosine/adenosine deaminase [Thermanaerovibrio velox DSM 12556]